jgi:UDP-glucose 4-epimerase
MKILVTGSAGHLGEALMRTQAQLHQSTIGVDIRNSAFTHAVGTVTERKFVRDCMRNIDVVLHTATLHKPHIATHTRQDFIDMNITGTLNLLEEAVAAGVKSFVYTSTTSAFGDALTPPDDAPAAWITEDILPVPKNIYGVTKLAAESLCELFYRTHGLPCIVLRTSRFFPEDDDNKAVRQSYGDANLKVNELLYRRVDIEDVVQAHLLAAQKAASIGFARYVISATTPFTEGDLSLLRSDAPSVVKRLCPEFEPEYRRRGWSMLKSIDRVYVNARARTNLGWRPKHDFVSAINKLRAGQEYRSSLAIAVGSKGYHSQPFDEGPYPTWPGSRFA